MRRLNVALAAVMALAALAALGRALADDVDDEIRACYDDEIAALAEETPEYTDDLAGGLHSARAWAACSQRLARDILDGERPDLFVEADKARYKALAKRGKKAAGALGRAIETRGRERIAWMKKARKSLRDFDLAFVHTNEALLTAQENLIVAELTEIERIGNVIVDTRAQAAGAPDPDDARILKGQKLLTLAELLLVRAAQAEDAGTDALIAAAQAKGRGELTPELARSLEKDLRAALKELYGALATAYRAVEKAQKKIEDALTPPVGKCELTDPNVREIGGGWVMFSRDGGAVQTYAGQTDITFSIFAEPMGRELYIGSDNQFVAGRPFVLFSLEGADYERVGTHTITGFAERDGDGIRRDFLAGQYFDRPEGGGLVIYNAVSGTLTIDRIRIEGKLGKRTIDGSFEMLARSQGGTETTVTGSFHLCRFKIFVQDEEDSYFE